MKQLKEIVKFAIFMCIFCGCLYTGYVGGSQTRRFPDPFKTEPELMEITAYCPCERCCGKWADGYTASGHKIQPGDKFAAAPKHIPFGTMLDIPSYGIVPVLDRGGAITVSKLDVFFPSHQEALDWGRKYLEVITHRIRNPPSGAQQKE